MTFLYTAMLLFVGATSMARAESGVFLEDMCSCSFFQSVPGAQCVRTIPAMEGMCKLADCAAGVYKCDMSGTQLCPRKNCAAYEAAPGVAESSSPFSCQKTHSSCVGDPDPNLSAPVVAAPPSCVFTDSECSCSFSQSDPSSECVHFDPTLGDGESTCRVGSCQDGYKCDCLKPTHMCNRKAPCQKWTPSTPNVPAKGEPFACQQMAGECTVESLSPATRSASTAPSTTAVSTAAPTTAAAPRTEALEPSTTIETTQAPTTVAQQTAPAIVTTTLAPTTLPPTTQAPATTACSLECPSCYVSNARCDSCIPDSSLSVEEAAQCDPCQTLPPEYCSRTFGLPFNYKCCSKATDCRQKALAPRGLGTTEMAVICARDCSEYCDLKGTGICSAFTSYQLVDVDIQHEIDGIPSCSEITPSIVDQF